MTQFEFDQPIPEATLGERVRAFCSRIMGSREVQQQIHNDSDWQPHGEVTPKEIAFVIAAGMDPEVYRSKVIEDLREPNILPEDKIPS